jgi:hypothetical protein
MLRIAEDYTSDHAVFSEGKALLTQADEFIIRNAPARGIATKFLRDPATIIDLAF